MLNSSKKLYNKKIEITQLKSQNKKATTAKVKPKFQSKIKSKVMKKISKKLEV